MPQRALQVFQGSLIFALEALHFTGMRTAGGRSPAMRFQFSDYAIDANRRELSRAGEAVHVEPQVFDLILHLVRNHDRVVSKDELIAKVWDGRVVSESTLTTRINAARRALGDSGEQQQFIKTIPRRGLRFVGEVRQDGVTAPQSPTFSVPSQEVTFCRATDGVNLAVATSGKGLPVVKVANWFNHIEFDWQSPVWSPLMGTLSERFRLIRYDERGTGLSDWKVDDISFDAFVRDLETVVDTLGLERFALFGISQGAAVSIAYAIKHPERVSRVALFGGFARGWRVRGYPRLTAQLEALLSMMRVGWGQEQSAFRQVFTSLFVPGATDEESKWWNDLQRMSTSPENAVRLLETFGMIDVEELAAADRRAGACAAQPRRPGDPVQARAEAGARHPQCALCRARKRQSHRAVA